MLVEAITYLLSRVDTLVGEEVMKKKICFSKLGGDDWSKEKEIEERDLIVKRCCSPWISKVPKIVNILNPSHEDFVQTCSDMHAYCEREKQVGILTLGLDRDCIYVNISMDPRLRKELLEAQCRLEMRK